MKALVEHNQTVHADSPMPNKDPAMISAKKRGDPSASMWAGGSARKYVSDSMKFDDPLSASFLFLYPFRMPSTSGVWGAEELSTALEEAGCEPTSAQPPRVPEVAITLMTALCIAMLRWIYLLDTLRSNQP